MIMIRARTITQNRFSCNPHIAMSLILRNYSYLAGQQVEHESALEGLSPSQFAESHANTVIQCGQDGGDLLLFGYRGRIYNDALQLVMAAIPYSPPSFLPGLNFLDSSVAGISEPCSLSSTSDGFLVIVSIVLCISTVRSSSASSSPSFSIWAL